MMTCSYGTVILHNRTLVVLHIYMQAPQICDYQTANYTLRIEDVTDSEMPPLTREGSYTGSNNSVTEVFTSGLKIDSNYTVFLSAAENQSGTEVSIFVNFSVFSLFCVDMNIAYTLSYYA